ncbi:SxtJ family membrane protein [Prochlorococcus marinus]|uniref:SxtJ family membrane protein n=1 Tax=Prochlorococcus marinus TaxID=1219 RepID=UPI0027D83B9B|nr:SxtJ family membrane protein [Prochlorococcus marinus]
MMNNNISKKILREFGFLMSFAFPILIGWLLPYLYGHSFRTWTLLISFPLLIFSIAAPSLLSYPYKAWMKLGYFLGWFNSRIILGIVFILVLQPIALIMRISGHDPLRRKKTDQKSYREITTNKKINLNKIF